MLIKIWTLTDTFLDIKSVLSIRIHFIWEDMDPDMNDKLINKIIKIAILSIIFLIEKNCEKVGIFFDFRSDPESDPDLLFHETDPDRDQIDMNIIY